MLKSVVMAGWRKVAVRERREIGQVGNNVGQEKGGICPGATGRAALPVQFSGVNHGRGGEAQAW